MAKKLPYKTFLQSFKYVPRVAINLLIKNNSGEILLTKRLKPPFQDYWHFPGSFLLKGETIKECLKRVAKVELGFDLKNYEEELLGVFEDLKDDPRGHVVDVVFGYNMSAELKLKPAGDTKELKFFETLPDKIGFNHRQTLEKLLNSSSQL